MIETFDYYFWTGRKVRAPDWAVKLRLDPRTAGSPESITPQQRKELEPYRLFSVPTRYYLRRRAWRYFRRIGKQDPGRYVGAISRALMLYQDADVADGLALIDNWGLVHALFHRSPVLVAKPNGWRPAEDYTLAELAPAPIFETLWAQAPRALVDLMTKAASRPVRQWAIRMIGKDPEGARRAVTVEELLGLLSHADGEVVAVAASLLRTAGDLSHVGPDRWLAMIEEANPAALEILGEMMERHLRPEQMTLEQVVRLAASRPLPLARLGLAWLRAKPPKNEEECRALLGLAEAECDPVRPEILRWVRGALAGSPEFRPEWVVELLDGRHADVRAEGWAWLREEPRVRDDAEVWRKLLETPYDDVRMAMVSELESRLSGSRRDPLEEIQGVLSPELLRLLWASVLLNVVRGNRVKPAAVRQLAGRIERRPEEAGELLPLLGVALRSVRGPEWKAGLAAVVRLVERRADVGPRVREAFPELQWA
jgi:hypothetical protein